MHCRTDNSGCSAEVSAGGLQVHSKGLLRDSLGVGKDTRQDLLRNSLGVALQGFRSQTSAEEVKENG